MPVPISQMWTVASYIIKQKLTFPTPAATAFTIRALHHGTQGAITAAKKTKGLIYSLVGAFLFKVVGIYAPGITFDWHVGWTLYRLGFTSIIGLENYGWILEFTPAFFGAGMLSGLNASWSFREPHSCLIFYPRFLTTSLSRRNHLGLGNQ